MSVVDWVRGRWRPRTAVAADPLEVERHRAAELMGRAAEVERNADALRRALQVQGIPVPDRPRPGEHAP